MTEDTGKAAEQLETVKNVASKLRAENQRKTEQMEKMQADLNFLEDRLRQAKAQAAETEKLDAQIESLRNKLEAALQQNREKDHEVRTAQNQLQTKTKRLEENEEELVELRDHVKDLKMQVQAEVLRTGAAEEKLKEIPLLREELTHYKAENERLRQVAEEKDLLLQHARRTVMERGEQVKSLRHQASMFDTIQAELDLRTSEVNTLRGLVIGKDALVVQKTQALDNAKDFLDEIHKAKSGDENRLSDLVNRDSLPPAFPTGSHYESQNQDEVQPAKPVRSGQSIFGNTQTFTKNTTTKPQSYNKERSKGKYGPPKESSLLKVILDSSNRPASRQGQRPHTVHEATRRRRPFNDFRHKSNDNMGNYRKLIRNKSDSGNSSVHEDNPSEVDPEQVLEGLSSYEMDRLLAKVVKVGDRATVNISKNSEDSHYLTGIIKFIGSVDKEQPDYRFYAGFRLDDPAGDTDGTYKGKRYFYVPEQHGKILKLSKIVSILDTKAGRLVPVKMKLADLLSSTSPRSMNIS